jgi:hypothetical protein
MVEESRNSNRVTCLDLEGRRQPAGASLAVAPIAVALFAVGRFAHS